MSIKFFGFVVLLAATIHCAKAYGTVGRYYSPTRGKWYYNNGDGTERLLGSGVPCVSATGGIC